MSTLSPTLSRRACRRLTTARAEQAAARIAASTRYTWLHLSLPVPVPADSRMERAMLSTTMRTDLARVIDIAAIVSAATGIVAFLSLVCR